MKKVLYYILLGCMLVAGLPACTDEPLMDGGGEIPEGETTLSAVVNFKPFGEALTGKGRSAGNAIKSIDNLCVLFYVDEGEGETKTQKLVSCQYYDDSKTGDFKVDEVERTDTPATSDKEHQAEAKTPQATISKLVIPYGKYYVYVVANMGDLNAESSIYKEAIQTAEGLKNIQLTWQYPGNQNTEEEETTTTETYEDCVRKNNQMFGYFTTQKKEESVSTSRPSDFDAPLLIIDKSVDKLHAWIRRAASKVTVAYDGTGLEEGVFIYLKSVTIKDIPQTCPLGANNPAHPNGYQPTEGDQGVELKNLMDGETIKYYEGETEPSVSDFKETYAARITKGTPLFGSGDKDNKAFHPKELSEVHTETTNALYFYENMQGKGKEGTPSDKRQVVAGAEDKTKPTYPDGGVKGKEGWKDAKPYGTYIEVDAYYVSINKERVGRGPIKYRFMLGKDVITDYNAERNYHYKLTLKFKGYANDADWHIEYEEPKPSIEVPNPYYISYLYNRTMNLPVKINTGGGELTSLEAEIIFNNWAPYGTLPLNAGGLDYARAYDYAQNPNNEHLNQPWNGFLSLSKTTYRILLKENDPYKDQVPDGLIVPGIKWITNNEEYYKLENKGWRKYNVSDGIHVDAEHGNYSITNKEDHLLASIPLYTRAKQMHIRSGYTGNNPYVAYQRHAKVKITAIVKVSDREHKLEDIVDIYQVRRIVNPKGIYRSSGNSESFNVTLLRLPRENAEEFVSFSSEGPWKAYVVNSQTEAERGDPSFTDPNPGFINLSVLDSKNTRLENGVIHGVTGSDIKFKINFNGTIAKNAPNRNAIVRVEYHNYTCEHLIFVHQGNQPQELLPREAKWHVSNLVSKGKEASNPLDEGSLFKYKNLDQPIAAKNQYSSRTPMINVKPTYFPDPVSKGNSYELLGGGTTTWKNIANEPASSTKSWGLGANLSNTRIAKMEDYEALFESEMIAQGYGVLYGDESTEPKTKIVDAYGYQEDQAYYTGGSAIKDRGIRGCFVYNRNTGNHIFLPVGASGYGHRKTKEEGNGVLRYSCGQTGVFQNLELAPLFYDLYMRPGAIYWANEAKKDNPDDPTATSYQIAVGWDINYFTFDFNRIYQGNVFNGNESDACFIRCVEPAPAGN